MSTVEIIRAWSDLDYRSGLSDDVLAALPPHPSGSLDEELQAFLGYGAQAASTATCTSTCTNTCTHTCSCTATQFSPRPCCC